MAFVNKKRRTEKVVTKKEVVTENSEITTNKFVVETMSWEDHAKLILNTLEKSGVDLYDETRTPGMYLNTTENKVNKIQKIIKNQNKNEDPIEDDNSKKVNSLLDFFNNNK